MYVAKKWRDVYWGIRNHTYERETQIEESMRRWEFTCLLSLDFTNEMTSVRRADIVHVLTEYGVDPHLLNDTDDFT